MARGDATSLEESVETALRHYKRAAELRTHRAGTWPLVAELRAQGLDPVTAIRQVLSTQLDIFERQEIADAELLRQRYLKGQTVETLAQQRSQDAAHVHRLRRGLIAEFAVQIGEANRRAAVKRRSERFLVRHAVFGLEALVDDLAAHLDDADAPPVVIVEGIGGLGKTTLARLIAQRFVGGTRFADVAWVTAKQTDFDVWAGQRKERTGAAVTPEEVLAQLADELGIERTGSVDVLRQEVRVRCLQQPRLIVLDNLETVADVASLAPVIALVAGPSRVLITTREHAPEALPPDLPRRYVPVHELGQDLAFGLLRRAAQDTGAPALAAATDDELGQIYGVTGGNPLALWLVAGQAHGVPWETFLRQLDTDFRRESAGGELFDYLYRRSWEQLSQSAQDTLLAMHRFEQGARYEKLLALSELDQPAFERALAELRRRMLLGFDGRIYSIHRLTYTFLRVVIMKWWP